MVDDPYPLPEGIRDVCPLVGDDEATQGLAREENRRSGHAGGGIERPQRRAPAGGSDEDEEAGDLRGARSRYEAALALRRDLGDGRGIAQTLQSLANFARRQDDYATAIARSEESLATARAIGDQRRVAVSSEALAAVAHTMRDSALARRHLEAQLVAGQLYLRGAPEACLQQAYAVGPGTGRVVAALRTPFALTRLREVHALLRLAQTYPAGRLERACRVAHDAGDGRYRTVRGLLERGLEGQASDVPPAAAAPPSFLRGPAALAALAPPTGAEPTAAGPAEAAPW